MTSEIVDEVLDNYGEGLRDRQAKGRGKLFYCVGTARSGKGTFANLWVNNMIFPNDCQGPRTIVCADNLRLALTGERYNGYSEKMIWAMKPYFVEALLSRNINILLDGTNTTEGSIKDILKIDKNAQYYLIDTHLETCVERAYSSGQPDLVPVIQRMHRQLEELKAEGLDKVVERLRSTLPKEKPRIQP